MSTKAKIILAYLGVALICLIYLAIWGASAHRGIAYNLGAGLVWPLMIPGVGKFVGSIVLVLIIGAILVS